MTSYPRRAPHRGVLPFVLLLLLLTPQRAHALYLDPATGSLILQVLAAGLLTAWFTIKGSWSRLRAFFKKLLGRRE